MPSYRTDRSPSSHRKESDGVLVASFRPDRRMHPVIQLENCCRLALQTCWLEMGGLKIYHSMRRSLRNACHFSFARSNGIQTVRIAMLFRNDYEKTWLVEQEQFGIWPVNNVDESRVWKDQSFRSTRNPRVKMIEHTRAVEASFLKTLVCCENTRQYLGKEFKTPEHTPPQLHCRF